LRYRFEEFAFDIDRRELHRGAEVVPITPQVFDLLEIPDPKQGARRQQGRPYQRSLEWSHCV
jgi:hypothetical protein